MLTSKALDCHVFQGNNPLIRELIWASRSGQGEVVSVSRSTSGPRTGAAAQEEEDRIKTTLDDKKCDKAFQVKKESLEVVYNKWLQQAGLRGIPGF